MKKTVYDFAKHCMDDKEFNKGGIPTGEKNFLDEIGFKYEEDDGLVTCGGKDLQDFYHALTTLHNLNEKYKKG